MHVTVTDYAEVTSKDLRVNYVKSFVLSKTKGRGRENIQSHCTANPTSDSKKKCTSLQIRPVVLRGNVDQKWPITQGCEVRSACYVHRHRKCRFHSPEVHL